MPPPLVIWKIIISESVRSSALQGCFDQETDSFFRHAHRLCLSALLLFSLSGVRTSTFLYLASTLMAYWTNTYLFNSTKRYFTYLYLCAFDHEWIPFHDYSAFDFLYGDSNTHQNRFMPSISPLENMHLISVLRLPSFHLKPAL